MQAQRDSFRVFFDAIGGQRWRQKGNWEAFLQGDSVNNLHGVIVSGTGSAIEFRLGNNDLSGTTHWAVRIYKFNDAVVFCLSVLYN